MSDENTDKSEKFEGPNTPTRGIFHAHFIYPDLLHIAAPSGYLFSFEERLSIVRVQKGYHALHLVDFNNKLNTDLTNKHLKLIPEKPLNFDEQGNEIFTISVTRIPEEKLLATKSLLADTAGFNQLMHWWMHRASFETNDNSETLRILRTRFYTDIIISYHVDYKENISPTDKNLFKDIFDRFIQAYRFATNDFRPCLFSDLAEPMWIDFCISPIDAGEEAHCLEDQLRAAFDFEIGIKSADFTFQYDDQPFAKKEPVEATRSLEKILSDQPLISDYEFLGSAKHAVFQLKNYPYGLLEAFIAAERMITEILVIWKKKAGISQNKLKDFAKEIPISYMINVEIRLMRPNLTKLEEGVLGKIDRARRMRNDLVHNAKRPTEEDAMFVVQAVDELFEMIQAWLKDIR